MSMCDFADGEGNVHNHRQTSSPNESASSDEASAGCISDPDSSNLLIDLVQRDGGNEAWQKFVKRFQPFVLQYCRRCGVQNADAHDVAQNVFVQVTKALPEFVYDSSRGRFRSWLAVVTNREIARYYRRETRARGGQHTTLYTTALHQQMKTMEARHRDAVIENVYEQAFSIVSANCSRDVWTAFVETWVHARPAEDVAKQLGRPTQWVYQAKSRVLIRMREQVTRLARHENL